MPYSAGAPAVFEHPAAAARGRSASRASAGGADPAPHSICMPPPSEDVDYRHTLTITTTDRSDDRSSAAALPDSGYFHRVNHRQPGQTLRIAMDQAANAYRLGKSKPLAVESMFSGRRLRRLPEVFRSGRIDTSTMDFAFGRTLRPTIVIGDWTCRANRVWLFESEQDRRVRGEMCPSF